MEVTLIARSKYVNQKVEQDFYWYDTVNKQMLHGRGGRMEFIYKPEEKRSIPKLVDQEIRVWGNNFQEIKKWIDKHAKHFNAEILNIIPDRRIIIEVRAIHFDELQQNLYRCGIDLDYSESELRQELDYTLGKNK